MGLLNNLSAELDNVPHDHIWSIQPTAFIIEQFQGYQGREIEVSGFREPPISIRISTNNTNNSSETKEVQVTVSLQNITFDNSETQAQALQNLGIALQEIGQWNEKLQHDVWLKAQDKNSMEVDNILDKMEAAAVLNEIKNQIVKGNNDAFEISLPSKQSGERINIQAQKNANNRVSWLVQGTKMSEELAISEIAKSVDFLEKKVEYENSDLKKIVMKNREAGEVRYTLNTPTSKLK